MRRVGIISKLEVNFTLRLIHSRDLLTIKKGIPKVFGVP